MLSGSPIGVPIPPKGPGCHMKIKLPVKMQMKMRAPGQGNEIPVPAAKPGFVQNSDDDLLCVSATKNGIKRERSLSTSSSEESSSDDSEPSTDSSDNVVRDSDDSDESGDEDQNMSLFELIRKNNEDDDNENIDDDILEENEPPVDGVPPRPRKMRFPTNLDTVIERLQLQAAKHKAAVQIKDESKTVSLGTSKINYIDPRIVFAWTKKVNIKPEKVYSKSLIETKFPWAKNTPLEYKF
eukprot:Tbor_TRINITY_DN5396_c0_g6::TRINITY_DN5396_c0_g6_i1::g.4632::m.4632